MQRLRLCALLAFIGASAFGVAGFSGPLRAQTVDPALPGGLRASIDENGDERNARRPIIRPRRNAPGRQQQRQAVPSYGNPPGSGAGRTGYISTNPRTPKRPPGSRWPAPQGRPGAPGSNPANANASVSPARPGSGNPGPTRPGASIEVPAGTATPPIRRKRPPEEDPFEPTGIHSGGFMFFPAIESTAGYDTNPGREPGGRGSAFLTVAPELKARSLWNRHQLNADLRGTYTAYEATPSLDRPFVDGRINGRLDITSRTRADFEARTVVSTDNPGSPDLQVGLARLPIVTTVGTTAGLTHQFNRFEVSGKGSFDRVTYQDSELTNGTTASNRDRNYDQYTAQLRAAYELTPGMKPFIEAQFDHRDRDVEIDRSGSNRNSDGVSGRVGTTFEFSRKLTGEISVGYLTRTYRDPNLPDLRGLIADGSLIWSATALTTLKLTAKSTADESTLPGVSGVLRRDFGMQVDHAFRRWLIGTARIGYGTDLYEGSTREDRRYVASIGVIYKLNREMQLKSELRREWLRSNVPGNDYDATIALVGLRLQR